jgi:CHRD domain
MQKLLKTIAVMAMANIKRKVALIIPIASLLILAISAVPVSAHLFTFTAVLTSGQEPPPNTNNSRAFGVAFVTFNDGTGEVCFSISYTLDSLTSSETNAHFHAPAPPGVNAGVIIQLPTPDNPKNGCVTPGLSQELIDALFAGLWYINIHTRNNPGGEIRGQVNLTWLSY